MVKIKRPQDAPKGGGKRGCVAGFSRQSRKRLLEALAQTRDLDVGAFITLTYPGEYSGDPVRWKRDLDVFLKRLKRIQPNVKGFWRLEFQKRGAPHYHLLVFGLTTNIRRLRQWAKLAWYEIVGSGDERHLRAGTQCDVIQNRKHATRYASKYAAKPTDDENQDGEALAMMHTGRIWGTFGKLNREPIMVFTMTHFQFIEIRRLIVRWLHSRASKYERQVARANPAIGFSIFGLGDQSCPLWSADWHNTIYWMCHLVGARWFKNALVA